jgi:hypothetical protein
MVRKELILKSNDFFLWKFYDESLLQNIAKNYTIIKNNKYVPLHIFNKDTMSVKYCGTSLDNLILDNNNKIIIKKQIVEFIKLIFLSNIAHRDLHIKNICWDGTQIWIIDWELITNHTSGDILNHYDLTGKGLPSPYTSNNMNLFKNHKYSLKRYLYPIKLNINDFK